MGDAMSKCWHNPPLDAPMAKLVDARDLKSLDFGCAGSTPAGRTSTVASLTRKPGLLSLVPAFCWHGLESCITIQDAAAVVDMTSSWPRDGLHAVSPSGRIACH